MTNDISPRRLWILFLCMVGVSIVYAAVTWRMLGITNTVLASQASVVPQVIVVPIETTSYPEIGEEIPVMAAVASWYGPGFYGRTTANGETYTAQEMTAAHKEWPFGTWVELENPDNGKILAVRINDRGPFIEGRDIDLSEEAAKHLGIINAGVVELKASVLRWGSGN